MSTYDQQYQNTKDQIGETMHRIRLTRTRQAIREWSQQRHINKLLRML